MIYYVKVVTFVLDTYGRMILCFGRPHDERLVRRAVPVEQQASTPMWGLLSDREIVIGFVARIRVRLCLGKSEETVRGCQHSGEVSRAAHVQLVGRRVRAKP